VGRGASTFHAVWTILFCPGGLHDPTVEIHLIYAHSMCSTGNSTYVQYWVNERDP
jgi:hypothetical protein